jgi:hypothetical protein
MSVSNSSHSSLQQQQSLAAATKQFNLNPSLDTLKGFAVSLESEGSADYITRCLPMFFYTIKSWKKDEKALPQENETLSLIINLIASKFHCHQSSSTPPPFTSYNAVFLSSFTEFVNHLRISTYWHVDANVIIWRPVPHYVGLSATHFEFHCTCSASPAELELTYEDFTVLRYETSVSNLLSNILDLQHFNEDPMHHKFFLRTNRRKPPCRLGDEAGDISSSGLLYCGIHIPRDALASLNNSYCTENRYGSCVLKFNPDHLLESSTHFYRLGTKRYIKEFSQMILISSSPTTGEPSLPWKVIDLLAGEVHPLEEIQDIRHFNWKLRYCNNRSSCGAWIHPEFVFVRDLPLTWTSRLRITFEHHQCIQRKRCLECQIAHEHQGWLTAIRANSTTSPALPELYLINCPLNYGYETHFRLALTMFALSVPAQHRDGLRRMQELFGLFTRLQFEEIMELWEKTRGFYYKDWEVGKRMPMKEDYEHPNYLIPSP